VARPPDDDVPFAGGVFFAYFIEVYCY